MVNAAAILGSAAVLATALDVAGDKLLPQSLGQVLMVGGVGYVLSTFVSYVFANADLAGGLLIVPATIGELWMIGYMIVLGVRTHARPDRGGARVVDTRAGLSDR